MPKERSPERDRALEIYLEHDGNIPNREIANQLGVPERSIGSWKRRDKWNEVLQSRVLRTANGELSWLEIENEYVTDLAKKPCTLKSLAEKYGIPLQTVNDHSSKHDWSTKRKEFRNEVIRKTASKAADEMSDDAAKAVARHFSISNRMLGVLERALSDPNEFFKTVEKLRRGAGPGEFEESVEVVMLDALNDGRFLNAVNAFEKLQKTQRQTLGILDEKDRLKFEGTPDDEPEDDGFLEALQGTAKEVWTEEEDDTSDDS